MTDERGTTCRAVARRDDVASPVDQQLDQVPSASDTRRLDPHQMTIAQQLRRLELQLLRTKRRLLELLAPQ